MLSADAARSRAAAAGEGPAAVGDDVVLGLAAVDDDLSRNLYRGVTISRRRVARPAQGVHARRARQSDIARLGVRAGRRRALAALGVRRVQAAQADRAQRHRAEALAESLQDAAPRLGLADAAYESIKPFGIHNSALHDDMPEGTRLPTCGTLHSGRRRTVRPRGADDHDPGTWFPSPG